MRVFGLVAAVLASSSLEVEARTAGPIAPSSLGKLQCYAPDVARKTCQSLASYRPNPKGGIDNVAVVLVASKPPIAMQTVSPVDVREGQVCGVVRPEDFQSAEFTTDGQPVDPEQAAVLREKVLTAMKTYVGHEICTTFVPSGGSLLAKESIDGVADPTLDERVIWISPSDGYTVSR